jgi:O-antigen/teichoic acid export membrane protein
LTRVRTRTATRSDARELVRAGSISFGGAVVGALCTFGLLVVVARGAGVASAGLFFQALALVSAGSIVVAMGSPLTVTQRVARGLARGTDVSSTVWAALIVVGLAGCVAAVLLIAGGAAAASWMTSGAHHTELREQLMAMAPAVPLVAVCRACVTTSRGVGEFGPAAFYDAGGQPLLRLVLCSSALVLDAPTWALGGAVTVSAAVSTAAAARHMVASLDRANVRLGRPVWDRRVAADFWRFSLPRGLEDVFQATNVWLLVVLVGALASPAEATTYAAVSRFTLASTLLMQAITSAMGPRFTAAASLGEQDRMHALFGTASRWMIGLSVPVCLRAFPGALLGIVSPDLPGGTVGLRVMAVAALVNVVTGPSSAAIVFAGRSTWNLWIAICACVAMLGVAVTLIPGSGANGASLAWAVAMTVQSILGYVVARHAFGLSPFSRDAVGLAGWSFLLAGTGLVSLVLLMGDSVAALVIGVAAATALLLAFHTLTSWRWLLGRPATGTHA